MADIQVVSPEEGPMYELSGVTKTYGEGEQQVHALSDVDLRIDSGEFVVIAGPSGSGKTTMLQLLGGLDRPSSGSLRFEGRELSDLGDGELTDLRLGTLGFVFQQFNLIPTLTAQQNVEVALAPHGLKSPERHRRAAELLESVGLAPRAEHLPSQLSGGEQQRVAIARALANEPRVILADEPTGNLDSKTGEEITGLLRRLSGEAGRTVILITHDLTIAEQAPRVIRLQDGRVLELAGATARL
jgi:putative ABC transport system ATP-binding protein